MIFISHSNQDADFVSELRQQLESFGLKTWVDCRELVAGNKLEQEIEQAIDESSYFLVVISPKTANSKWVRKEIKRALAQQKMIIPLLLTGITPDALGLWFEDDEPLAVTLEIEPAGLLEALPQILSALGVQAPDKIEKIIELENQPLEELILELEEPELKTETDKATLLTAKAKLIYEPADKNQRPIESAKFRFTAPIGIIELDDLRWYLEQYQIWPAGEFKKRANLIAANLPKWGEALYKAALNHESARNLAQTWRKANGQRRFSVLINDETLDEDKTPTLQAANALWALPWELLHDDVGYIAEGKQGGRVRRRLPNYKELEAFNLDRPIKVLLVSPRPTYAGYIDHRITAKPLVQALQTLGDLVELTILTPPTLQVLQQILEKQEFHVLHFDGHGVYDKHKGLGALCFEKTASSSERGAMDLVYADKLAAILREHRIPLVFLEACQTAQSEDDAVKSVAAALLNAGIVSVVAMTHSVLVVTAELFVREFYTHLAKGQRIGAAMLAGQRALMTDKTRFDDGSGDGFFIEDWFIPVLYQEREDPQLFSQLLPEQLQNLVAKQKRFACGDLPDAPSHTFIGRSPELLAFERLLLHTPYLVITGQGGAGKTTLAVELARWLVQTRRFNKAAFVCLERLGETRAVLDSIGRQLLPQFSVAEHGDDKAWQLVERELKNVRPLVLLDNCESLLPDQDGKPPLAAIDLTEFLSFCAKLQQSGATLLFTSRETLPPPFASFKPLAALSKADATQLLKGVLAQQQLNLPSDVGKKQEWLNDFVTTLNCHARALVLLAPLAAQRGFKAVTEDLAAIIAELEQQHSDNRELSLYASLELSLRRLSAQHREWVKALAVFHGGFSLAMLATVLNIYGDELQQLATELVQVGLAEYQNYEYYRIDPALSSYLKLQLSDRDGDYIVFQRRWWYKAMPFLVFSLYHTGNQNVQRSSKLTLLEMPNLLVYLTGLPDLLKYTMTDTKQVADNSIMIEELFARLDNKQALALAVKVRHQVAPTPSVWCHEQFVNKYLDIQILFEKDDLQHSYQQAEALLKQTTQAGETAYPEATHDIALIYVLFGKILIRLGQSEEAFKCLQQALCCLQHLPYYSRNEAEVLDIRIWQSECLISTGQLKIATELCQQVIDRAEELKYPKVVAVAKIKLADINSFQKNYQAALTNYAEARELFQQLNEPKQLALIWHQIGIVYRTMQMYEAAEQAYRESLKIEIQQCNQVGEAISLTELGNLYDSWGKLEQALIFYQQAKDIAVQLGDKMGEGIRRNNIANTLIKLQHYDEARSECQRAIECKKPFGHSAESWKTWMILHNLEQVCHTPTAAHAAKQQATQSYLAYRRDGGENMDRPQLPQLCLAVLQAAREQPSLPTNTGFFNKLFKRNKPSHPLIQQLSDLKKQTNQPNYLKPVIPKLIAILQGDRNPSLADDPELDYDSAAELLLLLEQLTDNIP